MKSKIFKNIPNILTISRIILIIISFILIIIDKQSNLALILIIIGSFTDLFDGIIARKFNLVSKLGMVLDQYADAIFITFLFLICIILGKNIVIVFLIIEIPRTITFLLYKIKKNEWLKVRYLNKVKTASLFITITALLLSTKFKIFISIANILVIPNIMIQTISVLDNTKNYLTKIKKSIDK